MQRRAFSVGVSPTRQRVAPAGGNRSGAAASDISHAAPARGRDRTPMLHFARSMNQPLNILLITSDQQHHDTLGATNSLIGTPALDRLCLEGTRFTRAYCNNPLCSPSRSTIITGMYPSWHHCWTIGVSLPQDVPTVGDVFQQHGYDVSLIGKAHFQPLASDEQQPSLECLPKLHDLDFWRNFHGPWYGFNHVEVARNHADEPLVGQHYAIWMEDKGLKNWQEYFRPWPPESPQAARSYCSADGRHWNLPQECHYTRWTGERTVAQIDKAASEGRGFFIWSSFHDPHPPYLAPEPWASMYDPEAMEPGRRADGEHEKNPPHFGLTQTPQPDFSSVFPGDQWLHGAHSHLRDRQELRKDMAVYYGMISFMDQQIGRILDCLDRHGLAESTLVVFTTDHGHFLGRHGLVAKAIHHYEDLLRVPFVARLPKRIPPAAQSAAIMSLMDLAPTFLAAADLPMPQAMTGINQFGAFCGGPTARTWSITENHHGTHSCHMRTFVTERHKITVYRNDDWGELFDLESDPGEVNNLWCDPAAADLKSRMLHQFIQAVLQSESLPMERIAGA